MEIKGSLIYKHVGFKAIIKGVRFCMYIYESTLLPNIELVLHFGAYVGLSSHS